MISDQICSEIISKVVSVAAPLKIILFGSRVTGHARDDSDIDILVIKDRVTSKHRESVELWKALTSIPYPKDIIVATSEEYEFYRHQAGSVFRSASEEGIEIYAR